MRQLKAAAVRILLSSFCSLILLSAAYARAEPPAQKTFDIQPQSLAAALSDFARQSGREILYTPEIVGERRSNELRGLHEPIAALKVLLKDSGLDFTTTPSGAILIGPPVSAGPSSSTSAPAPHLGDKSTSRQVPFEERLRIAQAGAPNSKTISTGGSIDNKSALQGMTIEEVVVTAEKRVERLQDVPVPVTAINAEHLTTRNQLRVEDYLNRVPGVSVMLGDNGSQPLVTIRGITTGSGTNPTIGIVVDEVSYGASANVGGGAVTAPDIDPGDLARVEVLRGPQGTLYGASSMGGLVKFVTLDPSTERLSGRLQVGSTAVTHSSDVGYVARGAVNLPIDSAFAVRVSGFTVRDPGYIDNIEAGERDVNRRDSEGGHVAALWRPSDTLSMKLSAHIQDSTRRGTQDVDTSLGSDPKQSFLRGSGWYERQTQAYSATIVAKLGAVDLTSATGYSVDTASSSLDQSKNAFAAPFFLPYAIAAGGDRVATLADVDVEKFTQELRASFQMGDRARLFLGGFYSTEDTVVFADNVGADSQTGDLTGTIAKTIFDSTFEEYAAFANVTIDVSDRWDVQIGGRYSDHRQEYPTTLSGPFIRDFFGNDPVMSSQQESSDTAVTYLFTPRFKVSPDIMAYARFASGYRPGGSNVNCEFSPGMPCEFKPDTTRNYDIGIKGEVLDHRLSFDASVYYIDWRDIQIGGILLNPNNAASGSYTGNVARAKSQGVELALETRPYAGLVVSAWAAYNDAELTEDIPPGQLFGQAGERLPFSSRVSGSVSLDQEVNLGATLIGFFGGTATYTGDRKGNLQATATRQHYPSYTQIDLRAGVRNDSWELTAFANNVTDERGVLRGGLDANLVSSNPTLFSSYFTFIQPRTVGLALSKNF